MLDPIDLLKRLACEVEFESGKPINDFAISNGVPAADILWDAADYLTQQLGYL